MRPREVFPARLLCADRCYRILPHPRGAQEAIAMISLDVNGRLHEVYAAPDTPLLWVLREWLQMTGTKYGCGVGQCGACSVLVDGTVERACGYPLSAVGASKIITIEGLSPDGSHPVQRAWLQ